ncbi:probable phospholipid-transporting ATPase IF, partial [Copidosoma floridanum]|uniref:probable phospholipid-transporting ATPase IF n=1 Tax=Copidosoma floridanum TaxID=29053 RepID=UPI0006C9DB8D
ALYDSTFLMGFNAFFSAVPIVVYGICEQNYSYKELLDNPRLYQLYRKNYLLSAKQFIVWMFIAFWQTTVIYFIPYFYWKINPVNLLDSTPSDHWCFCTCIMHLVTLVINLQLLVLSSYWTFPYLLSITLTELFFVGFTLVYSLFHVSFDGNMLDVFPRLLLSPSIWFLTLLVIITCLMPSVLYTIYENDRPARVRGKLESREKHMSDIFYSPVQQMSTHLPVKVFLLML